MRTRSVYVLVFCLAVLLAVSAIAALGQSDATVRGVSGQWVAGDMHSHTWLSDGEETEAAIVEHAFTKYGLDWLGTSDHGAPSTFDPLGKRCGA